MTMLDEHVSVTHDDVQFYVFEALLEVSPNHQDWARVAISLINGWRKYKDHPKRLRQLGGRFFTDVLAFQDPKAAAACFRDLSRRKQEYKLRLVRIQKTVTKLVVLEWTSPASSCRRATPRATRPSGCWTRCAGGTVRRTAPMTDADYAALIERLKKAEARIQELEAPLRTEPVDKELERLALRFAVNAVPPRNMDSLRAEIKDAALDSYVLLARPFLNRAEKAEAERDELTVSRDDWRDSAIGHAERAHSLQRELSAARADGERKDKALAPFAKAAECAEEGEPDDYGLDCSSARHELTIGDLYRARAARSPEPKEDERGPSRGACLDCRRAYGDEYGFPDLLVPDDVWAKISPTGNEGGLLCPSCMCRRAYEAGVKNIAACFVSGPFASSIPSAGAEPRAAMIAEGAWQAHRAFWKTIYKSADEAEMCERVAKDTWTPANISKHTAMAAACYDAFERATARARPSPEDRAEPVDELSTGQ